MVSFGENIDHYVEELRKLKLYDSFVSFSINDNYSSALNYSYNTIWDYIEILQLHKYGNVNTNLSNNDLITLNNIIKSFINRGICFTTVPNTENNDVKYCVENFIPICTIGTSLIKKDFEFLEDFVIAQNDNFSFIAYSEYLSNLLTLNNVGLQFNVSGLVFNIIALDVTLGEKNENRI